MNAFAFVCMVCALAAGSVACGGDVVVDAPGGAGEGGSGQGVACGDIRCPPGKECCNASCGTCTDPGEGCTAIACD